MAPTCLLLLLTRSSVDEWRLPLLLLRPQRLAAGSGEINRERENNIPKFAELYIFDTKNEIANRIQALNKEESETNDINPFIADELKKMLDQYNPLVKTFRHARNLLEEHNGIDVSIRIIGADKGDPVQYEMPHTEKLEMLIVGELNLEKYKRDIIVSNKNKELRRISIFHPAYMALQYPLLFPYGERGFQLGINYHMTPNTNRKKRKRSTVTVHEHYKYHVHFRPNQPNPYLCYGRLSKQAIVDARAIEDEDRLMYIARNQDKLRAEYLQGIYDAVEKGLSEIILQGEQPNDRPDIIDIRIGKVFRAIVAILYSIEFQKRGLPHVHILVWLDKKQYQITLETIDLWISAEIPDPNEDPLGYVLVSEHMMHGPCGEQNENSPCMKKGKCSKYYPKQFQNETNFTDNGFTQYRRRDTNVYIRRDNHNLNNKWVVPHNLYLLKKYQAHINVEYVNKSRLLKYLCKYVNKGPDKATIIFERIKKGEDTPIDKETKNIDEIKEYLDCRLLGFDIHYHWPPVERLPVHLPLQNILYENARNLTYCEFPQCWRWDESNRKWTKRKQGFKIGRLYYVNPIEGECFYLRMLLMIVKGATSYKDLRTYNGTVYQTFKEAYLELQDKLLEDLELIFAKNGANIYAYNLPHRSTEHTTNNINQLIQEELNYDKHSLQKEANELFSQLNTDKKMLSTKFIISYLRAQRKIVLTVASSGVASLLLPNGRTAHSRFKIPIDIDEISICDIKRGTKLAELLTQTDLIIWDEALMTNRHCFEALDRSLRDILSEKNSELQDIPFGGKVVVLGGDPKQILPVIENASKSQIISASIFKSYLWNHVNILYLHENMRLSKLRSNTLEHNELNDFNKWILSIRNGTIKSDTITNDTDEYEDCNIVEIPTDLLITTTGNKIQALVETTFLEFISKFNHPNYLKDRAILATTNEIVEEINEYMIRLVPGLETEYFSADTISKCTDTCNDVDILYPIEYLNSLNANNFPTHKLKLKVGVPIMLLRNLNQTLGLCNGTRLIVTNLGENVIEAVIITGTHNGEKTYIPRINLTTRGYRWPFTLCRRQFPVKVCYSMTINKSQRQTLSNVGVYLKQPVFTHG
ncbi:hypothetical protein BS78_03G118400 [Paspalum vaginatum]|nr:hypothetical protein BS78_03G118400 [Paspalum vaginatum]